MESPVEDTLIVQLNSLVRHGLPTGVREISLHANRLAFNAPLIREIELIETVRECWQGRIGGPRGRYGKLATHRFHLIEAGRYTGALSPDSTMKPDWAAVELSVQRRTRRGRQVARPTIAASIGRRSTVDLKERFLTPERAGDPAPTLTPNAPPLKRRRPPVAIYPTEYNARLTRSASLSCRAKWHGGRHELLFERAGASRSAGLVGARCWRSPLQQRTGAPEHRSQRRRRPSPRRRACAMR